MHEQLDPFIISLADRRPARGPAQDLRSHGWNAIELRSVTNSWVRRVTARYFGYSAA